MTRRWLLVMNQNTELKISEDVPLSSSIRPDFVLKAPSRECGAEGLSVWLCCRSWPRPTSCHSPLRKGTAWRAPGPPALSCKRRQVGDAVCGAVAGGGAAPSGLSRGMAGCYDGVSWDLLWLKVRELSRLPSGCNLACIIPVLLRETGNVWDFRSWTMGPSPSWFLQHEWNGIGAKVRLVTLRRDGEGC